MFFNSRACRSHTSARVRFPESFCARETPHSHTRRCGPSASASNFAAPRSDSTTRTLPCPFFPVSRDEGVRRSRTRLPCSRRARLAAACAVSPSGAARRGVTGAGRDGSARATVWGAETVTSGFSGRATGRGCGEETEGSGPWSGRAASPSAHLPFFPLRLPLPLPLSTGASLVQASAPWSRDRHFAHWCCPSEHPPCAHALLQLPDW